MRRMNELVRVALTTITTTGTGISKMEMSITKRCRPVEEVRGVR